MKVLLWVCGSQQRFAGPYIAAEAERQGFEVCVTGSRVNPRRMLVALHEYKPDIVFCLAIRPNFRPYYEEIRRTGAKLVLWYPDMTERRRDRMWRGTLNGVADVLIFSILETAQRYRKLAPTVLWMPQYFDHRFCSVNGQLPKRLDPNKPIYDLCFIGSCDPLRNRWLDDLAKDYKCFFARDGIKRGREVRGWEMAEAYAQSKIAFNIQRQAFLNPGDFVTSNRTYNAMGSGAMFINHHVAKLDLVFEEGTHCAMHCDTLEDLRYFIKCYMMDEEKRERVARTGQELILRYHTLEQRVREYWSVMQAVCDGRAGEIPAGAHGKWVKT